MGVNLETLVLSYAVYDFLTRKGFLNIYKDDTVVEMYNILKKELVKRKIFPEGS